MTGVRCEALTFPYNKSVWGLGCPQRAPSGRVAVWLLWRRGPSANGSECDGRAVSSPYDLPSSHRIDIELSRVGRLSFLPWSMWHNQLSVPRLTPAVSAGIASAVGVANSYLRPIDQIQQFASPWINAWNSRYSGGLVGALGRYARGPSQALVPVRRRAKPRSGPVRAAPTSSPRAMPVRRPYGRSTRRSYGAGRTRTRYRPRLRRRVGRPRLSYGYKAQNTRHRVVCNSLLLNFVTALGNTGTTYAATNTLTTIREHCLTTGSDGIVAGGAMTFVATFSLAHIAGSNGNTAWANQVGQQYDMFRIDWITVRLRASFNPREAGITTTLATGQYDFSNAPQYDDNVTWIERDGSLQFTNALTTPANGDLSELVQNREGAKRHGAFKDIIRKWKPNVMAVFGQNGTGPAPSTTALATGAARPPKQSFASSNMCHMGLGVAFSYKGQQGTTTQQPKHYYDAECVYDITCYAPLF